MNKHGFTLVEFLITIVIIGLLSGIGIISFRSFFDKSVTTYYENIERNMTVAANDYFTDHRDQIPKNDSLKSVLLSTLVSNRYIEPIKDKDGNICSDGEVFIYRSNGKNTYIACLYDCGDYNSHGTYCEDR